MRYNIVRTDPVIDGAALAVELPGGALGPAVVLEVDPPGGAGETGGGGGVAPVDYLPLRTFRDFYAFEQHVRAARARRGLEMIPEWYEIPVFYFSNATNLLTDGDELKRPPYGEMLDFELEVGCVIGRQCRDVRAEEAEQYILGYCVINDWSMRDTQREEMKMSLGPAKGKDFGTTVGPVIVTPDELAPYRSNKGYDCVMTCKVNGVEVSRGNWNAVSFSFGEMIARASAGVTLYPGEVIGSGTVGTGCLLEIGTDKTGGWLKVGDTVEMEIAHIGRIVNRIAAAEQTAGG